MSCFIIIQHAGFEVEALITVNNSGIIFPGFSLKSVMLRLFFLMCSYNIYFYGEEEKKSPRMIIKYSSLTSPVILLLLLVMNY